jgi:AraC-like DNA-binding protein
MICKNVMPAGDELFKELQVGYVGNESLADTNYYYDNSNRSPNHVIIQFTVSGSCFFDQAGQRHRVGVGEAFITEVPSETQYGYPEGETTPYSVQFLALYGETAAQLARSFRLKYGPVVDLARRPESLSIFREIFERYRMHGFRDRIEESTTLYQLFGALYREATLEAVRGDCVATCYQRIQSRFRESANINEIARDVGVTREHLARSFQQRYGQSPAKMLRELRLREARMVIESGVEDYEAVARAVGFFDVRTLRRYL